MTVEYSQNAPNDVRTASVRGGYGSAPFFFGGTGRGSRAARENEAKFQPLISPKRLDGT